MAKKESVQKRLERVRPPRVQLSYDVEVGDAIETKELPFVVGVMGDFSGAKDADHPTARLKARKFVHVDLDTFNDVMEGMAPNASFRVVNKVSSERGEFLVNLNFKSLADFSPEAIVQQVEPLRRLLEARTRLSDLRNKLAGNERLEDSLAEVLRSTDAMAQLSRDAGLAKE